MFYAPQRFPRRIGRHHGYALIAALIAVTIVALAAAGAIERSQLAAKRERERELLFIGEQFRKALESYGAQRVNGAQQFPKTLEDLLEDDRQLVTIRHLRRIYRDPMTGEDDWVLDMSGGRIIGVHSRSDGVPLTRAGFPPSAQGFGAARTYADWDFLAIAGNSSNAAQAGANAGASAGTQTGGDTGTVVPMSSASSLSVDQINQNNFCFQQYVSPQGDCSDEPPPYGKDQSSCIRYFQQLYEACLAAPPSSGASSPGP